MLAIPAILEGVSMWDSTPTRNKICVTESTEYSEFFLCDLCVLGGYF